MMSTTVTQELYFDDQDRPYNWTKTAHSDDRAAVIEQMRHTRPDKETDTLTQWWEGEVIHTFSKLAGGPQPLVIRSVTYFTQD